MYSYEDRLRAVSLYIKLGKRVQPTIRQLGYPAKNALKSWHREYEQHRDLHAGYARLSKYSQMQRERAVQHYLEHGRCLVVTIKALGYPSRAVLRAWLQELHPDACTPVVGQALGPDTCGQAGRGDRAMHEARQREVGGTGSWHLSADAEQPENAVPWRGRLRTH